jgi:hypothetical protein
LTDCVVFGAKLLLIVFRNVAIKDITFERRKHASKRVDSFIERQVVFEAEIFEMIYQIGLLACFLTLAFVPLLS